MRLKLAFRRGINVAYARVELDSPNLQELYEMDALALRRAIAADKRSPVLIVLYGGKCK